MTHTPSEADFIQKAKDFGAKRRAAVTPPADEVSIKGTGVSGTRVLRLPKFVESLRAPVMADLKRAHSGGSLITYILVFLAGYGVRAGWLDAVANMILN